MIFQERISCSINEAVAATGISRSKLYVLMDEGKIHYADVGKRRRIIVSSLLALLVPKAMTARQMLDRVSP